MSHFFKSLLYDENGPWTARDRTTHAYVVGQPGTGKSRALESWVLQDIVAGHGVGVIDPHGDLFRHLIIRLSNMPEVWDRVVVIDPCNEKWVTAFNPLEAFSGISQERLSLFLTDIIGKIWKLNLSSAPRTMWLLTNTFLALSNLGLTLLELPRFLLDRDFRESLLPRLANFGARTYFQDEFPRSSAAAHQWATPVLNKIGNLIFDPDTSLIISGGSKFRFRDVLDHKLILLVNLPKGVIGEGASGLLGAFIVAHIQKAALARANTLNRVPFYLYLDEFQNYTTDNIKDILSESRKYALSLILVHQYLEQLSSDLQSAVLNTAGSIFCFRVGYHDGYQLAKEIFPAADYFQKPKNEISIHWFGKRPSLSLGGGMESSGWEALAEELTKLSPREFWYRRRGLRIPNRYKTFYMPVPRMTDEVQEKISVFLDTSGKGYSRLKKDVQEETVNHQYNECGGSKSANPKPQESSGNDDISFWSR